MMSVEAFVSRTRQPIGHTTPCCHHQIISQYHRRHPRSRFDCTPARPWSRLLLYEPPASADWRYVIVENRQCGWRRLLQGQSGDHLEVPREGGATIGGLVPSRALCCRILASNLVSSQGNDGYGRSACHAGDRDCCRGYEDRAGEDGTHATQDRLVMLSQSAQTGARWTLEARRSLRNRRR